MSKKLIAGAGVAAAFAVALAPLATFATETTPSDSGQHRQVDTLVVNLEGSCEFGHDFAEGGPTDITGVAHDGGDATWNDTTNDASAAADRAYATIEAGTVHSDFATTTLKVFCNTGDYAIKAIGTNLTSGVADNDFTPAASLSALTSVWSFTPTMTGMTAATGYTSGTAAAAPTNETKIAEGDITDNAGDTLQVVYGVSAKTTQPAGTYVGTMTYNLYSVTE